MPETVLIVDDEDGVRRTFQEWLTGVPSLRVLAAADAETALQLANSAPIDLAVLDWNLGSGSDGLRLLEDLVEFQPEIVAILVTGYANQATPLDALRMGVRDYLDKNQDLRRETFLAAIHKQLDRIVPAKRTRELNRSLGDFRDAVEKVLPLVRASAALNDPVPLPTAVHSLFRFLLRATGAKDGALIVRQTPSVGPESSAAFGVDGQPLPVEAVAFGQTLASGIISLQDPCIMTDFSAANVGSMQLMPFEKERISLLAAPLRVASGVHVVLELFDKPQFTEDDKKLVAAAAEVGAELLRSALAERSTHRLLFDAVEAAMRASETISESLSTHSTAAPPSAHVLERLKQGLSADANAITDGETGLKLIEAIRELAVRHGSPAVDHCIRVVQSVRTLLDAAVGPL